jgi:hypothetical protein
MKRLAIHFLTFIAAAVIGAGASSLINSLPIPTTDPPSYPTRSEITQVSYEVIYDACSGEPHCPGYELTFVREGREEYLSRVIKITTANGAVHLGDLWRGEFDQLVTMLESREFYKLEAGYPRNTGCADCVIKKLTVVRSGLPKTVVHLTGSDRIPVSLWTIERAIEGTMGEIQWQDLKEKHSGLKF